jgi:undecaprenol kinase
LGRHKHRHGLGAAFGYAFAGLRAAWRDEPNLRIHTALGLAVAVAAAVLRLPPWAWALLALAVAGVIATELLNAAVEAVVDLVSPEEHPLAKRAKDVAAAGVLVAALGAAGVGVALACWILAGR